MTYKNIYRKSGVTYYYRLIRPKDNTIWNNVTGTLEAAPDWASTAIAITEISGLGIYPIILPANLPTGYNYDLVVYVGVFPSATDAVDSGHILKHGSIFGF